LLRRYRAAIRGTLLAMTPKQSFKEPKGGEKACLSLN